MAEFHNQGLSSRQDQMEIDEINTSDAQRPSNLDFAFGSSGPCILEEY